MISDKMKTIIGIDPGPVTSGFAGVTFAESGEIFVTQAEASLDNWRILTRVKLVGIPIAIETPSAIYGGVVGASTIDTILWAGRFLGAAGEHGIRISPQEVRTAICGTAKAKDSGVRQALIDRFGPVGTKKAPGALYGVKSHAWRALAVAVAAYDMAKAAPAEKVDMSKHLQ